MPMSNYPGGFMEGVSIRGIPINVAHPGQVFFVNNSVTAVAANSVGGSDGNSGTYQKPFASINKAVSMCQAGRGDIICVMPGHVEVVAAAAGVALSKAGVAVIGLGAGRLRPQISLTATAATIAISAAGCTLYNVLVTGDIDAIVSAIVVSAADVTIDNVELRDVTGQMALGILTTAAADRLDIGRLRYAGDSAAGGVSAIALVGGDRIRIHDCSLDGNFSTSAIDIKTTAATNIAIHDCYIWTKNSADLCVKDTVTGSTGRIGPNLNLMLTDNAANITEAVTGATFHLFDPVYVCNLAGEKALLINWTASTDA